MERRLFSIFCILCCIFAAFSEGSARVSPLEQIKSIEKDKQTLLSIQDTEKETKSHKSPKLQNLRRKIRTATRKLEASPYTVDLRSQDFTFVLSDSGDSYSCSFSFAGKTVFEDSDAISAVSKDSIQGVELTYIILSDGRRASYYTITPTALKITDKDGKTLFSKKITGKTFAYQYSPATAFDWNTGYASSGSKSIPKSSRIVRGCDIVFPNVAFYAKNEKFHSAGLETSLDILFRNHIFFGGRLGVSFNDKGWKFLGIVALASVFRLSGGYDSEGMVYGTATGRLGLYLPVAENLTVKPYAAAGCVNSRGAVGGGLSTAFHKNPRNNDGFAPGLIFDYGYFLIKGGGNFQKFSVGLYFKDDVFMR